MSNAQLILIILASAFIGYEVLRAVVLRATEEVRRELAHSGKRLLARPDLTEDQKILVTNMLDDVFDWRFMAFATIAFPIAVFRQRKSKPSSKEFHDFLRKDDVEEFMSLHFKSVMAASPFFSATFVVVATVTIGLLLLFVGITALTMAWGDAVNKVSPMVGKSNRPPIHGFMP